MGLWSNTKKMQGGRLWHIYEHAEKEVNKTISDRVSGTVHNELDMPISSIIKN